MNKYFRFIFDSAYRFNVLDSRGYFKKMSDIRYLKIAYKSSYNRVLDLKNPITYNEKLQWLKLYNRRPEYTKMVDKYEAKKYIADRVGKEYVIPTLGVWDRYEDIDFSLLPDKFVLKCTHDSGGLVVCRNKKTLDVTKVRDRIINSLNRNYYYAGREWPYKNIPPRIIAEKYMSDEDIVVTESKSDLSKITVQALQKEHGLLDYKFMCFDGVVKAIFLDIGVIDQVGGGHSETYYRNIYDSEWNKLPFKETRDHYPLEIEKPACLDEMIRLAEKLSAGCPHLRVDMYYVQEKILIGELTFYHGSGLSNNFIPKEWDHTLGDWIKLPSQKYEQL